MIIDYLRVSGLSSKPVEFDGFKIRIVQAFPDPQELQGIAVSQPVSNQIIGSGRILASGDIGQGNVVLVLSGHDAYFIALYVDLLRHSSLPLKGQGRVSQPAPSRGLVAAAKAAAPGCIIVETGLSGKGLGLIIDY